MQIIAQCPRCRARWILDSSAADRRLTCPACWRLFKVPKLEELAKATQVIQDSKTSLYVDEEGRLYG